MNGIVRHIVITHLSRFTIIFVIHSSSLHNITSTQPYYDTINVVSTTNCLILIYQLFLQLFNVFITYIHISVMPTFYGDLQVIMFVLLHLYCMYLCPSWRSIFSIAIQYVFLIQLSCIYRRNSIHVQQSSKFDIFNMYFLYNYHASIEGIPYMYSSRQNLTYFNMYFLYNYHASIEGIPYMYSSRQNLTYLILHILELYFIKTAWYIGSGA